MALLVISHFKTFSLAKESAKTGTPQFRDKTLDFFDFGAEFWVDCLCHAGYNKSIIAKKVSARECLRMVRGM